MFQELRLHSDLQQVRACLWTDKCLDSLHCLKMKLLNRVEGLGALGLGFREIYARKLEHADPNTYGILISRGYGTAESPKTLPGDVAEPMATRASL